MATSLLPFFPPLAAALHHATLTAHLPAVHSSLPSQLIAALLPPAALLLTLPLSLPPLFPLLTLLPYIILSTSALPTIQLALLWLSLGSLPAERAHRLFAALLTFCTIFLTNHLPTASLAAVSPRAPAAFFSLALLQLAPRSRALAELYHRQLHPRKPPLRRRQRRTLTRPIARLPRSVLAALLAVLSYAAARSPLPRAGSALVHRAYPRPLPDGHVVLAQARGPTGLVSVVWLENRRIMLTADLSVLGGRHAQEGYMRDSIFSQFYVHEAVRLTRGAGEDDGKMGGRTGRSLCIGLGVGVVADALHRLGCVVDAVELDPHVAKYARGFFEMSAPRVYVMDALDFLRQGDREGVYDFVVHDLFTGGAVPTGLFALQTWRDIRKVMKADGVLAVNYVGQHETPPESAGTAAVALIFDRLAEVFGHVRAFSDGADTRVHNIVFFASGVQERVTFREPVDADFLGSQMRQSTLAEFERFEVKREALGDGFRDVGGNDWVLHMAQWETCRDHMKLMRELHTRELWPALLRMELMK